MRTTCPGCDRSFTVGEEYVGRKVRCGNCQQSFKVDDVSCPFCREDIRVGAKKCKHCGETIDVALRAAEEARRASERRSDNTNQQVVIHQGGRDRGFDHTMHVVLTVLTCGAWFPIWILCWLCSGK